MKKLLLVLTAFVITFTVNAQETAVSIEEEYKVNIFIPSPNQKKKKVVMVNNADEKYIVAVEGKTADEIYTMTELAIAKHWKNPDEVINGKSAGKFIKINGGGPTISVNSLGMIYYYTTSLDYLIQFKDGRFMYTVTSKTRIPPSKYTSGGNYLTVIPTKRKNGKEIKLGVAGVDDINNSVSSFINAILISDLNQELDTDW
jgi:hypothetical protein|tara:strand:+ start:35 stop:637 length:603 start_codon:yes stop_codon:yes gene_type:complete